MVPGRDTEKSFSKVAMIGRWPRFVETRGKTRRQVARPEDNSRYFAREQLSVRPRGSLE